MTASPTVKVSTFWASLALTIILAAGGNYVLISNKLSVLEVQVANYQTQMVAITERVDELQTQVLHRTDDRFRRQDWEREEAQINARFNAVIAEMSRKFDSLEVKLDTIINMELAASIPLAR